MKLKSKKGFGIAQVLIAAVLIGFLSVALSRLMTNAIKSQTGIQNSVDFDIIKSSILNLFLSSKCDQNFKNISSTNLQLFIPPLPTGVGNLLGSPLPIHKIMITNNSSLLDMSQPKLGGGLTLSKMEFVSAEFDNLQSVGGTNFHAYIVKLHIEAQKNQNAVGGLLEKTEFVLRILANSSTGLIQHCGIPAVAPPPPIATCRTHAINSPVHDSLQNVCCNADELAIAGNTPNDNSSKIAWQGAPHCMQFSQVGLNNLIQVKCCKFN